MSQLPDPQIARVLIEKRCELYGAAATLLMDLEDALDQDDAQRVRYLLRDLRRALRGGLAFLTEEVFQEMERIDDLAARLPTRDGADLAAELAEDLGDRLQLLHVKLARTLRDARFQDVERIVGLPPRLRQKLTEEGRDLDARARHREREEQAWRLEAEARDLIGRQEYSKAVKSLRKAIRLDGERAVFHNDLGVVLSLLGRNEEAIGAYRTAVGLNESHPEGRTDEWTTSYYNLGIALRKAAAESLNGGHVAAAAERLREARAAFDEYTRLNASGAKVADARRVIESLAGEIEGLEARGEQPS